MKVKEGCLAIVIYGDDVNLGIICKVGKYLGDQPFKLNGKSFLCPKAWHVESVSRDFILADGKSYKHADAAEFALKPVSGLDDPDYDVEDLKLPSPVKETEHG